MAVLRRALVGITALICSAMACNQIAGLEEGTPVACTTVQDCTGAATPCRPAVACEQGECVFDSLAESPCETMYPGICAQGTRQCDAQGQPVGDCTGESPGARQERCDAAELDEDCDGQVNESGEGCVCGDGYVSEQEDCDDGAAGDGDRCSAICMNEEVMEVATGYRHTCALLRDGRVKCWGSNANGALGLGTDDGDADGESNRGDDPNEMGASLQALDLGTDSKVTSIEAGGAHTCAVLGGGLVKCWGYNYAGQLGLGDTQTRGITANQMGDQLPPVLLGSLSAAKAVSAGGTHTCALLTDGKVKCWGLNESGQLGIGETGNRGVAGDQMGDFLQPVDLGKAAQSIAAGEQHTCALLVDGNVKCWGMNNHGQLGVGDYLSRGDDLADFPLPAVDLGTNDAAVAIAAGRLSSCALVSSGKVKCWGNPFPQPVEVNLGTNEPAIGIAVGSGYTCALLASGDVKCWGGVNSQGQLGLGDAVGHENPAGLSPIDLGIDVDVAAIAAGFSHTCAILADGSLKCWGSNSEGWLGLGDTEPQGDELGEMGDALKTVRLFSETW